MQIILIHVTFKEVFSEIKKKDPKERFHNDGIQMKEHFLNDTFSKSENAIRYYIVKTKRKFNCTNEVGKVSFCVRATKKPFSLHFLEANIKCHLFYVASCFDVQQYTQVYFLIAIVMVKNFYPLHLFYNV